jgi:hypothetical protein
MLVRKKRIVRQKDHSSIMKTVVFGILCVNPHSELLCISRGGTKLQAIVPKKTENDGITCWFWWNDAYPFGPSAACYIVGKSPLRGGTRLVRIRSEYYSVHIYILILHLLTSSLNLKLGRDLDYA